VNHGGEDGRDARPAHRRDDRVAGGGEVAQLEMRTHLSAIFVVYTGGHVGSRVGDDALDFLRTHEARERLRQSLAPM
jgi:hypothetical protein